MGVIYNALVREIAHVMALVSPQAALRYWHSHTTLRTFAAAKTTGANQNFKPKSSSAAAEITRDWQKVTDKARSLERDNCYVAGMVRRRVAGTVGDGAWPRPKITDKKGNLNLKLNLDIINRWDSWQGCACANGDTFSEGTRIGARHLVVDGEFLVQRSYKKHPITGKQSLRLNILECDQLDNMKDAALPTGGRIVGGIEIDASNEPIAYWIKASHPGDAQSISVRVPASEIIHVFDRQRASQIRGICSFVSVIMDLHDICEYQDASMILARVATAFGIFVESPYPQDFMPAAGGSTDEASQPLEYLQPGSINKLRPGEKIGSVKAEQPGGAYEPFVNSRLRGASVGAGFSFEAFSNNYSGSSYSSARQAMLIERQLDRLFMSLMEGKLYSRVYRWFLETEMLNGLRLPGWDANPMPYLQVKWSRPRQEWIDPQKEANAVEKMLTLNLTTQTTEAENRGEDFDEICATRAAEVAKQKALGIYALDQEIQVAKVESQSQILAPEADPNADDTAPAKTAEEITHVN